MIDDSELEWIVEAQREPARDGGEVPFFAFLALATALLSS